MKRQPSINLLDSWMQTVKDHRTLTWSFGPAKHNIHQRDNDTYQKLFKLWWKFNCDNQDELMLLGFKDFDEDSPQMYELDYDLNIINGDIVNDYWTSLYEMHYNELQVYIKLRKMKETNVF